MKLPVYVKSFYFPAALSLNAILAVFFVIAATSGCLAAQPAGATAPAQNDDDSDDWMFDNSTYTNDPKTGKEVYSRVRIDPQAGAFTSSPWAANGKLFLMSEDGDTFVVAAGPEYKLLGKNSLDEMTMATPAISNGSLIVRTASKLYRIGKP